jgi:hypothetical protein
METLEQKIENKLKELSDFSNAKVGDKVYSIRYGEKVITNVFNGKYPISTENCSHTIDGKQYIDDVSPVLFKSNPFIEIAKLNNEERWIEVNINGEWEKRKLIAIKVNKAVCWTGASTEEEVLETYNTSCFDTWREIQPEVELTLEQIAEKFGIDVNKLKIKK